MNASDTPNEELSINDGVVRLLAEFIRDRDAAQAELSKVTAERDEARATVDTISRQRNQSEAERDIARAELASMDVAVAWRERWQPVIAAALDWVDSASHIVPSDLGDCLCIAVKHARVAP